MKQASRLNRRIGDDSANRWARTNSDFEVMQVSERCISVFRDRLVPSALGVECCCCALPFVTPQSLILSIIPELSATTSCAEMVFEVAEGGKSARGHSSIDGQKPTDRCKAFPIQGLKRQTRSRRKMHLGPSTCVCPELNWVCRTSPHEIWVLRLVTLGGAAGACQRADPVRGGAFIGFSRAQPSRERQARGDRP